MYLSRFFMGFSGLTACAVLIGCVARESADARTPQIDAPLPETPVEAPPSAHSEIGGLNEDDVNDAFNGMSRAIEGCFQRGAERVSALGGRFKMKLRITTAGELRWAYLAESNLGDRDTEKCLLSAARAKTWPKPLGGDGLAEKTFEIDAPKAPADLEEKRFKVAIALARKETAKCRTHHATGVFVATTYLRQDGHVLSAGVTPPNEDGEEIADCMSDKIKKLRFGSVGQKVGKLSFELR